MLSIDYFVTGPIETNTSLVTGDNKHCLVVDPSLGCAEVINKTKKDGLVPQAILLTHGHYDHIMGLPELFQAFGDLPVYLHDGDVPMFHNNRVNGSRTLGADWSLKIKTRAITEGPTIWGGIPVTVFHVPGHTPGGCAFLIGETCLSGDTLFAGDIGRSDLPGGDGARLIREIKAKLLTLPEETIVVPGHGEHTTVGREKRTNRDLML